MSRIAELVEESRLLLAEEAARTWAEFNDEPAPVPWPPLDRPPTENEIAQAEADLGFALPQDLKDLYTVGGSGIIGLVELLPIDVVAHSTRQALLSEQIVKGPEATDPIRWRGELPQGDVVLFAAGVHDAYLEVSGALKGRIVGYDSSSGSNYIWARLADNLEGFLTWSLEAVRFGGVTIAWAEAYRCRPTLLDGGYSPGSKSQLRFESFIRRVHPSVAAAGGTLAYYHIYQEPTGQDPIGLPLPLNADRRPGTETRRGETPEGQSEKRIREALKDMRLPSQDLRRADLAGLDLASADLAGLDLGGANLAVANLTNANLAEADLSAAYLAEANLNGAHLVGAHLNGAHLVDAYLVDANLSAADLTDANLSAADLTDTDLTGANLTGANLSAADLSGAKLTDANLAGAYWWDGLAPSWPDGFHPPANASPK